MTEQMFLKKAKQAIKYCDDELNDYPHSAELLQLVWMSNILKDKKAIFFDVGNMNKMFEVTYDGNKEKFYVDKYSRVYSTDVKARELYN